MKFDQSQAPSRDSARFLKSSTQKQHPILTLASTQVAIPHIFSRNDQIPHEIVVYDLGPPERHSHVSFDLKASRLHNFKQRSLSYKLEEGPMAEIEAGYNLQYLVAFVLNSKGDPLTEVADSKGKINNKIKIVRKIVKLFDDAQREATKDGRLKDPKLMREVFVLIPLLDPVHPFLSGTASLWFGVEG